RRRPVARPAERRGRHPRRRPGSAGRRPTRPAACGDTRHRRRRGAGPHGQRRAVPGRRQLTHHRSTTTDTGEALPSTGAKYDIKRDLRQCYAPANSDWQLVEIPAQRFLAADGHGDPNTSEDYARVVEALYSVAYTIKFTSKRELGRDFVVGPLEGLWWADRWEAFVDRAKDEWHWRMLISVPEWITGDLIEESRQA